MECLLKSKEVCSVLGISKPTLYRLTSQGKLKKVKISEGHVGWLQSSVNAFIANLKEADLNNS